jgi:hypothetical protein
MEKQGYELSWHAEFQPATLAISHQLPTIPNNRLCGPSLKALWSKLASSFTYKQLSDFISEYNRNAAIEEKGNCLYVKEEANFDHNALRSAAGKICPN